MTKEVWKKFKKYLKDFWFIVWKDDSFRGWILSIIFLFIIIKFIFFPILNLTTGTSLPLAIVESCSMYHEGNLFSNFDKWWIDHSAKYAPFFINKLDFQDYNFKNGFNKGDILFIIGVKPEKINIGDVLVFNAARRDIIHRVIEINFNKETRSYTFSTIGDNNNVQLPIETNIKENQIVGRAVFKLVPYAGWVKLAVVDIWSKLVYGIDFRYIPEGSCKKN